MTLKDTCGEDCRDTLITYSATGVVIRWPGRRVECSLSLDDLEELRGEIVRRRWDARNTAVVHADELIRYAPD